MHVSDEQWNDWTLRMLSGEHLEAEMIAAGVLPDADTWLPQTNAAIHILGDEVGYGTPDRKFIALCGVSWDARGSTSEHKYFHQGETQWHKHVNCSQCREAFGLAT